MFIMHLFISTSWIGDEIVLDGFQILHLVQVELGGLILTHVSVRRGSCCSTIGLEQGPVGPDARSSIRASNGSWSAWVAVTVIICELVFGASWVRASSSIRERSLEGWTGLASSAWSSDL